MATRKHSSSAIAKPSERLQRKTTQRLPATRVESEGDELVRRDGRPDPATTRLLQILAEEIDDLRSELQALREEVAVLRAMTPVRKVTGSYRGVTKPE